MIIKSLGIILNKKEFENVKILKNYHKILTEKLSTMEESSFEETFQVRKDIKSIEKQIKKLRDDTKKEIKSLLKNTVRFILFTISLIVVAFLLSLVANWLYQ